MPSGRRQQYTTVEVKPESVTSKSNIAPASPGSPKKVAFAPCIKAEARQLTHPEAWSLYNFEAHARQCPDCYDPREGQSLCATGHGLAQDVAEHVYRKDGIVYSKKKDNHKLVQVDLPRDYTQVPRLLKSMERALRTTHRTVPIISYDQTYPVSARRTTKVDDEYDDGRKNVVVEPARSGSKHQSRTKHKTTRYKTVVVNEDVEASASRQPDPVRKERRGSLYYEDLEKQRKEPYRVEIREPERRERRRDRERPRSEYFL